MLRLTCKTILSLFFNSELEEDGDETFAQSCHTLFFKRSTLLKTFATCNVLECPTTINSLASLLRNPIPMQGAMPFGLKVADPYASIIVLESSFMP